MSQRKIPLPDFRGSFLANRRLHLLELLGSGAYGKVYRALDTASSPSNPVYYAVKCMFKHEKGTRGDLQQLREFALHAKVAVHPNIVTFHDVIYDHAFVYVVLNLCSGGDLHSAIIEKRLFYKNDELLRTAFLQIIDGVQFCHQQQVFHRDLKPDNILCSADGKEIFLADFGLATHNDQCEHFGCGSMFYKSPECLGEKGQKTYSTQQSDIWSLGVVLVNLITGRCPWKIARTEDPSFNSSLHEEGYFRRTLPMSPKAVALLKRIFHLDPLLRITLPELRAEIIKIDTFFISDADLLLADDQVKVVDSYFTSPQCHPTPRQRKMQQHPFASLGDIVSVPQLDVSPEPGPAPRHRAPCNTALFTPPRRRSLLTKVVKKLKAISRTSTSSRSS
ncbi:kinase-like domain-containing protein [Desarmillaria tabescens]|uniref:non-specific serine/threonine protein kinase n=1 Tax=Armillaria tabescens TaxID=1929756 RepID=A0AA39NQ81_ARMTA|nr:kinase-like domain-containing protein [Desarmillaria tabescens]KAK0469847.1 kinase-like domain-containing protein [Desarmillaria tabescens]